MENQLLSVAGVQQVRAASWHLWLAGGCARGGGSGGGNVQGRRKLEQKGFPWNPGSSDACA